MNKILYSPKEGTTGFWGLIGYPEVPPQPSDFDYSPTKWSNYREALESCKEKKLEIVNPEECFTYGPYARNGSNEVIKFKEGEIFDLPIGYEFKSYKKCQHNGIHNSTCIYHEVLRLVKTETKDNITAKQTDIEWLSELLSNFDSGPLSQDQCVTLIMKRFEAPQPEPEESQTWTDIYNLGQEHGVRNYIAILSSEIEKEKVKRGQPSEDLEVGKIIGLQIALQLLDSVTPKK